VLVGQLHDDEQLAVQDVDSLHGKNKRVPHLLDAIEGLVFLVGARTFIVKRLEAAIDELDRLEQSAWGFALPDFPEAPAAQWLDQAVTGNRFRIRLPRRAHESPP